MGRTVSELSATMPIDELVDWFAINRSCPVGDERMDYLFAHVCLRIFQAAGVKKPSASQMNRPAGPGDWTIDDFLLFRSPEPEKPEVVDLAFMRARFGGLIKKGDDGLR